MAIDPKVRKAQTAHYAGPERREPVVSGPRLPWIGRAARVHLALAVERFGQDGTVTCGASAARCRSTTDRGQVTCVECLRVAPP